MIHYTAAHMISDTLCNMKKLQKSKIENVASLGFTFIYVSERIFLTKYLSMKSNIISDDPL